MKRKIPAFSAFILSAAILISGCGNDRPPAAAETDTAQTSVSVTQQQTEETQEQTSSQTSETTAAETSQQYEKGVNPVRTAEELAGKKVIALTFDDGPNTGVTNEILDIIEEYGIKASFYVIGQNINEESAKAMQRAHSLGCEINSHSFTHSYMNEMSAEDITDEMERTAQLIYDYAGEYPKFFRPPYIAVNTTMYDTIDLPFISGVGCNDWDDKVSVEKRVKFLTKRVTDGEIILMHDAAGNEKTVEAVRQAVPQLLEDGFEFVTTEELFIAKGITPAADKEIIYSYATETGWQQ